MALVAEAKAVGQKKVKNDVIQGIHSISLEQKRTYGCSIDSFIADCWLEVTARSYATAESIMMLCLRSIGKGRFAVSQVPPSSANSPWHPLPSISRGRDDDDHEATAETALLPNPPWRKSIGGPLGSWLLFFAVAKPGRRKSFLICGNFDKSFRISKFPHLRNL
jgi:hypothetical protein